MDLARKAAGGLWGAVRALDRIIGRAEGWGVTLILIMMILLAFLQVILRNVFSFGFSWMEEMLRVSVLWIGFLGASLAIQQGRHINIDVLSRALPKRFKPGLSLVIDLVMLGVCVVFLTAAVDYIRVEREFGDVSGSLGVPVWSLQLIFPLLFAVGSFRFGIKAVESLLALPAGWKK
jgi:TRAP-type C4-dicarboxylate transport system permease small subunit